MSNSIINDARRALARGVAKLTASGLFVPTSKNGEQGFCIGGVFSVFDLDDQGRRMGEGHNRVVLSGLNQLLNVLVGKTPVAPFYLAPFINDVQPQANWTAANFNSIAGEFIAYEAAQRPQWNVATSTNAELTNIADIANATLVLSAGGPYTIRGCALITSPGKQSTTGTLFAAGRFDADITGLAAGGKLGLEYRLAARDSADPAP